MCSLVLVGLRPTGWNPFFNVCLCLLSGTWDSWFGLVDGFLSYCIALEVVQGMLHNL